MSVVARSGQAASPQGWSHAGVVLPHCLRAPAGEATPEAAAAGPSEAEEGGGAEGAEEGGAEGAGGGEAAAEVEAEEPEAGGAAGTGKQRGGGGAAPARPRRWARQASTCNQTHIAVQKQMVLPKTLVGLGILPW